MDVFADDGWILLAGGERVGTLRTWHDPDYEEAVEYRYESRSGLLRIWNVYKQRWAGGEVTEEKLCGNAGFLVDELGETEVTFRCSSGSPEQPDFTELVFRVTLL